jgi:plasmid stabilization system protein ParE
MDSMNKKYRVEISIPTTEMLLSHAHFLAKVSEKAAARLVDSFYEKAKSLEHMPERCPYLVNPVVPDSKYRKLLFEKRYLLVFLIEGDSVYVDAVVDGRQDYGWLL